MIIREQTDSWSENTGRALQNIREVTCLDTQLSYYYLVVAGRVQIDMAVCATSCMDMQSW